MEVRPWKGTDGKWYSTIALDACNATAKLPCIAGSRNELWRHIAQISTKRPSEFDEAGLVHMLGGVRGWWWVTRREAARQRLLCAERLGEGR